MTFDAGSSSYVDVTAIVSESRDDRNDSERLSKGTLLLRSSRFERAQTGDMEKAAKRATELLQTDSDRGTTFVVVRPHAVRMGSEGTRIVLNQDERTGQHERAEDHDEYVARASDERISLLLDKYAHPLSPIARENEVRIAMLTQRLRRLSPRVTRDEAVALDEVTSNLEASAAALQKMKEELGLT